MTTLTTEELCGHGQEDDVSVVSWRSFKLRREVNHHSFDCEVLERGLKEQCAVSDARIHWVNTSTMPADSLSETGHPARAVMESFLAKKHWRCTFDPPFESGRRRKARGAPLFSQEDLDEINPSTDSVAFDTLLQDELLSEDVREIMRMKYE